MKNFDVEAYLKATVVTQEDAETIENIASHLKFSNLYSGATTLVSQIHKNSKHMMSGLKLSENDASFKTIAYGIIPSIDIPITDRCNIGCAYCSHFGSLATDAPLLDTMDLKASITLLHDHMGSKIDNLFITGGEPMLHPDFIELARFTAETFTDVSVFIYSNLTLYKKYRETIKELYKNYKVGLIGSVYPGVNDEGLGLALEDSNKGLISFMTGGAVPPNFGDAPMSEEKKYCVSTKYGCYMSRCLTLRDKFLYTCPMTAYIQYLNSSFGTTFKVDPNFDRINLENVDNPDEILALMNLPNPFCKHCSPNRGNPKGWRHSSKGREEWLESNDPKSSEDDEEELSDESVDMVNDK